MSNREQMNFILLQIEGINNSVVANASTETVRSFQPMMRKECEVRTDLIN